MYNVVDRLSVARDKNVLELEEDGELGQKRHWPVDNDGIILIL